MLHLFKRIIILFIMLMGGSSVYAQNVAASLDQENVAVGDTIVYNLNINGSGASTPTVKFPPFDANWGLSQPNLESSGMVSNQSIVNGRVRENITYTQQYTFTANKQGKFDIPGASISIDGKTIQSNSVTLTVGEIEKASDVPAELKNLVVPPKVEGSQPLQKKLNSAIFILPIVSNKNPFNGEQIRVSYYLVIDLDALNNAGVIPSFHVDGIKVPELNQFLKEELFPFPQEPKFRERQFGNKKYVLAPIYEVALSSTKSGKLTIDPFETRMIFSMAQQNTPNDPFLNNPMFSRLGSMSILSGGSLRLIARSPSVDIDVKSLPQSNVPSEFNGAVGKFKISAAVDKEQVKANEDTFNYKLTIEGVGDAASLSAPQLPSMKNFIQLGTAKSETTSQKQEDIYVTRKQFTYVLRATQSGIQEIPPFKFSYFEPTESVYKVTATLPIKIDVQPGATLSLSKDDIKQKDNVDNSVANENEFQSVVIKPNLIDDTFFASSNPARLFVFAIPMGLLALGIAYPYILKSNNRKVTFVSPQDGSNSLKNAEASLAENKYDDSMRFASNSIREAIAWKSNCPISDATLSQIEEALDSNPSLLILKKPVIEFLEECDETRYLSGKVTQEKTVSILNRAKELYKEIARL